MPAKKPRSTKKAKSSVSYLFKSYNFFLVFAVVLGMLAGVLMVKTFYQGEPKAAKEPVVTLGAIEYDIADGKATKRDSPLIASLRTFLNDAAAKDCSVVHSFMEPSQFSVITATKDLTQVLLGYGCGDVSARMFAVYENDAWKFISPTNQFDTITNAPLCSHVQENGIKKEIAPVCHKVSHGAITYHVR